MHFQFLILIAFKTVFHVPPLYRLACDCFPALQADNLNNQKVYHSYNIQAASQLGNCL